MKKRRTPTKITLHDRIRARGEMLAARQELSLSEYIENLLAREIRSRGEDPYDPVVNEDQAPYGATKIGIASSAEISSEAALAKAEKAISDYTQSKTGKRARSSIKTT